MLVKYTTNNTTLFDCYIYSDKELKEIANIIYNHRLENNLPVTRTVESYYCELVSHKRLYKLGVQKERTKDADLEENINNFRNIAYKFIGGIF